MFLFYALSDVKNNQKDTYRSIFQRSAYIEAEEEQNQKNRLLQPDDSQTFNKRFSNMSPKC